nr:DUF1206 domain-containing protein [Acidobacteriota bacterium]
REASPWVVRLGRLGFAALGSVYVLIGILAVQAAISARAAKEGTRGALAYIVELPFGQILLVAVAAGLVFHALWRFTQALMDTDNKGSDAKGKTVRLGFVGVGLIHLGLAFSAVKIILGARSNEGFWAKSWTAWLLAQPFGQWLVAFLGAGIFVAGIYFFYQALSAKFLEDLLFAKMSDAQEKWGTRFGRFGFAARGAVFCIIGIFLAFAAWYSDAGETRDFGGALRFVEQQSYGAWLLALVAVGLFSYGLFMLFLAKYRRMVST